MTDTELDITLYAPVTSPFHPPSPKKAPPPHLLHPFLQSDHGTPSLITVAVTHHSILTPGIIPSAKQALNKHPPSAQTSTNIYCVLGAYHGLGSWDEGHNILKLKLSQISTHV